MEGVVIRLAEARDDEAIGELLVRAFVEQYARLMPDVAVTERRIHELRDVGAKRAVAKVWVAAERFGSIVGTVSVWPPGAPGAEAWVPNASDLRHLAVRADARGQGVSTALLDVAEAFGRTVGGAMVLHVRRGARGVRELYEQRGYRRSPDGDLDLLPEVFLEAFIKPWSR